MASLPLELHEVLEQEYVSMYGPLDRPAYGELYDSEQIVDAEWVRRILCACNLAPAMSKALEEHRGLAQAALAGETAYEQAMLAERAASSSRELLQKKIAIAEQVTATDEAALAAAARAERDAIAARKATLERVELAKLLSILVAGETCPDLSNSPALTPLGRLLIAEYDSLLELANERDKEHGALELRRAIVDDAFTGGVRRLRDIRLDNIYSALHRRAKANKPRTALCISGGGIRSATFALGIIQGLASGGLLKKFDYLSTVSGGGYIGSWLSSWVRRHRDGIAGVENDLQRADTAVAKRKLFAPKKDGMVHPTETVAMPRELPKSKIDPEPEPVRHLREYSNYLSPRLGLLSADSWTLASLYIRNLLLNLLVLVPILAALLAWPRLFSYLLAQSVLIEPLALPWIFAGCVAIGFAYIGWTRPVTHGAAAERRKPGSANVRYFVACVLPLTAAATALSIFWARSYKEQGTLVNSSTLWALLASILAMTLLPHALYYGRYRKALASVRRSGFVSEDELFSAGAIKSGLELFAVSVALVTSAILYWLLAVKVFYDPLRPTPQLAQLSPILRFGLPSFPQQQFYVCFSVPAVMLVFFVQASVFVGLSSRRNEDSDREWWGRAGAIALMITAAIALVSFIAVFGPIALYNAPVILGSIGGVSGIAAALLGFSDKTPANHSEDEGGTTAMAGKVASSLVVPVFVVFLLASISLASTWLIQNFRLPLADASAPRWSMLANLQSEATRTTKVVSMEESFDVKESMPATPSTTATALRSAAHLTTIETATRTELLIFALVGLLGTALSWGIGVNKFSMHALYRNRLIRAYLGASRYKRDPDSFTGFDENDNLQMWELRREAIWSSSIVNVASFIDALQDPAALEAHLWKAFSPSTQTLLKVRPLDPNAPDALVQNLNNILMTSDLSSVEAAPSWATAKKNQLGYSKPFVNRAILDAHFPMHIRPMARPDDKKDANEESSRPPMHVVNVALNLTSGQDLAWQQRMAESFTITPLHSGSFYLGYRDSREYGGDDGISLGTAVATSGAAASPNMGYHSSPLMAFLLAFFNIRLGSWLGNPGLPGQATYQEAHPTSNLVPLFAEMCGLTNDQSKWVYLSDGGHFENLGLYEMVLRRCHRIVLSDAVADRNFSFEDLGNAIRKIRTDLGVPIDIGNMDLMTPRSSDGSFAEGRYVAWGTIRYSAVDKDAEDGTLIYIKAGVYKDDWFPRDVYNYARESLAFPHESTADQFFSESQFESYRALGRHAINEISGNYPNKAASDARLEIIANTFENVDLFINEAAKNSGPRQKPASS